MSIKQLINKQTIIIDDHKRGNGEIKIWENPETDIHIDKRTNYRIDGKRQEVRIRIPINSNRVVQIDAKGNKREDIPRRLRREIQKAFEEKKTRESFMKDVIDTLRNYDSILSNEEKVELVLKRLSSHFDLQWTDEKISTYKNDILEIYTRKYTDEEGRQFFITVDRKRIKIGENSGYTRYQNNIL